MATRADALSRAGAALDGVATSRGGRAAIEDFLLAERAQVPLWSPAAFGLGIVLYFMLPWAGERLAAVVAAGGVAALGLVARGATGRLLVWGGVLVALGVGIAAYRSNDVASPVLRDRFEGDVAGTVESVEVRSGRGQVRFILAPDDPGLPPHVRLSLKSSAVPAGLAPGAHVTLRAMLLPPQGPSFPGGYDFARTLWFAQIGATGYPLGTAVVTRPAPPPAGIAAWLDDARARLTRRIEGQVPGDAGAISAAFVTGDQGQISTATNLAMRWSGMAHLLSISGVHIAIVVGGTMWLTRALLCLSPWIALRWPVKAIAAGAAALTGIAYTILAGRAGADGAVVHRDGRRPARRHPRARGAVAAPARGGRFRHHGDPARGAARPEFPADLRRRHRPRRAVQLAARPLADLAAGRTPRGCRAPPSTSPGCSSPG